MSNHGKIRDFSWIWGIIFSIACIPHRHSDIIYVTYHVSKEEKDNRLLKIQIAWFIIIFRLRCCLSWSSLRYKLLHCLETLPKSNPKLSLKVLNKSTYFLPNLFSLPREGMEKTFFGIFPLPRCTISFIFQFLGLSFLFSLKYKECKYFYNIFWISQNHVMSFHEYSSHSRLDKLP